MVVAKLSVARGARALARAVAVLGLLCSSRANAAEAPNIVVQVESSRTIYTATPASSSIPGFKPHINFPYMKRRADGGLIVDATVGQTQSGKVFGIRRLSTDNGLTWSDLPNVGNPNSSLMRSVGQTSVGVSYAAASGTGLTSWIGSRYQSTDGGATWTADNATFSSGSVAYKSVYNNYNDIVSAGSTLYTTAYATRANDQFSESVLLSSNDGGLNWSRKSTIAMFDTIPDMGSEGPSETSLVSLSNGSLLAVYRTGQSFPTTDVNLTSPSLFFSISSDQGTSWSAPKSLGVAGVFPTLRKLEDGTVALAYGRYGTKLMFADPTGRRWTAPTVMYNGPTSGHTELRPTNDGRYVYVHDQSSFFGPSYDSAPPPGYVYDNEQSANLKALRLNIVAQPSTDDYNWAVEYHGDFAPTSVGQGWVETNTSALARRSYLAQLGTDYANFDTISTTASKQLYYTLPNTQAAWQTIDFATTGVVLDFRARLATSLSVNEGAADVQLADGTGLATFQVSSNGVYLEGLGGNGSQATYNEATHPGFSTNDWHRYRIIVKLDPATGQRIATVYLDNDLATPILSKTIATSATDSLRFGDLSTTDNSALDVDFVRFSAAVGRWNSNSGGSWTTLTNWTANVPNAVDAVANFTSATAGSQNVSIDSAVTVGQLNLDGTALHFVGGGSLHLQSTQTATVNVTSGNHLVSVPVVLDSNAVVSGAGQITFGRLDGAGGLTLNGNMSAQSVRVSQLTVNGAFSILAAVGSGQASRVSALTIAGSVDLGAGAIVVDYAGASPESTIRDLLRLGSLFTSAVSPGGRASSIGYGEASQFYANTAFDGVPLDGSSLILVRTLSGDATLDQVVSFDDLLALAQHYGENTNWLGGDFNYDGIASFDDLLSIAQNYAASAMITGAFESDWQLARSLAPEPACALLPMVVLAKRARHR